MPTVDLTREEFDKLRKMKLAGDSELKEALGQIRRTGADSLAAVGAGDQIGGVDVPPAGVATFLLLDAIGSPFLNEDAEEIPFAEVANAFYIVCRGRKAAKPILGVVRREAALKAKEAASQASPEHWEAYLRVLADVHEPWAAFEDAAAKFWEDDAGNPSVQDVANVVQRLLNDAVQGFKLLPPEPGAQKKTHHSTPTGLRGLWCRLRRCLGIAPAN